jgi:hypothetical protein
VKEENHRKPTFLPQSAGKLPIDCNKVFIKCGNSGSKKENNIDFERFNIFFIREEKSIEKLKFTKY